MSQFAQSIKRLYQSGRINLDKVKALLADGKITVAEYDWMIGG